MSLALVFPGTRSALAGAGAPWVGDAGWSLVERAGVVLGEDVERLLLDADAGELEQPRAGALSTYLVSLLAWQALSPLEVVAVAGHGMGEITALVAGGVLTVEDGLRLVDARGRALDEAVARTPGGMATVVGLERAEVEQVCAGLDGVWVAYDDAPDSFVVSGTPAGLEAAGAALREAGARRVLPFAAAGPFHTPLVAAAQPAWDAALAEVSYDAPDVPVLSATEGGPYAADVAQTLARSLTAPVRWRALVESLPAYGVDTVLEVGPGGVLADLVRRALPDVVVASVATVDDMRQLEGLAIP